MEHDILEILKEIQPGFDFTDNVDFIESGYLDSFDVVQVISMLEDKFDIKISALDLMPDNFNSLAAIKRLVEKYQK